MLESNPSFVIGSIDIENAFNELERRAVLKKIWEDKRLREIWYFFGGSRQQHHMLA